MTLERLVNSLMNSTTSWFAEVMVVDASAIIAILHAEKGQERLAQVLIAAHAG
jgi:hypothetical protein